MNDFKPFPGMRPASLSDAAPIASDAEINPNEVAKLPVGTYDDYKSWCDKVRQEWDVN